MTTTSRVTASSIEDFEVLHPFKFALILLAGAALIIGALAVTLVRSDRMVAAIKGQCTHSKALYKISVGKDGRQRQVDSPELTVTDRACIDRVYHNFRFRVI
jgi:nitrite reductase/ring-hydroxylating ferredoxin subunit